MTARWVLIIISSLSLLFSAFAIVLFVRTQRASEDIILTTPKRRLCWISTYPGNIYFQIADGWPNDERFQWLRRETDDSRRPSIFFPNHPPTVTWNHFGLSVLSQTAATYVDVNRNAVWEVPPEINEGSNSPSLKPIAQIPVTLTAILIPVWIIIAVALIFPALWLAKVISSAAMRSRRRKLQQCASCGYDLRGTLSKRCPECGSPSQIQ